MNLKRLFCNKYADRYVFHHVAPEFHHLYKLFRHGTYDCERLAMYRRAILWLMVNGVKGDICEFGTANGESFFNMYFQAKATLPEVPRFFLFDSFEGLPENKGRSDHEAWKKGAFSFSIGELRERMEFLRVDSGDVTVVKGFYDQTLSPEGKRNLSPALGKVMLLHIDCDLYESTLQALNFVSENLQHGTVVLFDDYYCCSANLSSGEAGAFGDWLKGSARFSAVPWFDYSVHGKAFVLNLK